MTPLRRGETKKTGQPDDRLEHVDRAAEQPSPYDREPAEERDAWWYVSAFVSEDW